MWPDTRSTGSNPVWATTGTTTGTTTELPTVNHYDYMYGLDNQWRIRWISPDEYETIFSRESEKKQMSEEELTPCTEAELMELLSG